LGVVSISPAKKQILFWKTLGFVFLVILISRIKWEDTLYILRHSKPAYFIFACFLEPVRFFIETIRWRTILYFQRIRYSLKDAFLVVLASAYLGHITPGRAGNFIRAFYLSSDTDTPLGVSFSSVVWEKYLELALTLLFGFWGAIIYLSGGHLVYVISVGIFILLLLFYLIYSPDFQKKIFKIFASFIPRVKDLKIENFQKGLQLINFKVFITAAIISFISFFVFAIQGYLVTMALNINIGFLNFVFIFYLCKMVSRLVPISFSGWGSKDVSLILIFKNLGINEESAFAFTVLFLFSSYFMSLMLGFLAWEKKILKWQKD
jgi:hypothetical protein